MLLMEGKDRNVNDTIAVVKNILSSAGFNLIEKELLNPINGIWSVNLQDNDSFFYTNGKGGTKEAAIASAYCEFLERLGTGFFFYDYAVDGMYNEKDWVFSPDEILVTDKKKYRQQILNKKLWDFYDTESVLEFSTFIDSGRCNNDSIIAFPFINGKDDSTVNFPLELLKNIYASNGLSAGNSREETIIQGLSEAIERGVKNYIISECISLPNINVEYLIKHNFMSIIKDIESYGYPVVLKDASIGGRFPVICALLIDKSSGTVLTSFGSHPNPLIAIERTLTELLQGRKIESLDGFSTLTYNSDQVADEANLESHFINSSGVLHMNIIMKSNNEMVLWDFDGDRGQELTFLQNILNKENYDYYYRAYSIGEMWVSQSIIPQLSEIYPIEDLFVENRNRSQIIRTILKSKKLDKKLINEGLKWFEESYIPGSYNLLEYVGVATSEDDPLYNMNADEWELLLLISKKAFKKVHKILTHQIVFDSINQKRLGLWQCILALLEGVDVNTLQLLYSDKIYTCAIGALNGLIPREYYPSLGEDFSVIEQHKQYIEVYKKYRRIRS